MRVRARAGISAEQASSGRSQGTGGSVEAASLRRRRWLALVVLCAGQLMIVLDATVVNVALPVLQRDLHFTQSSVAWVIDAYLITFGGLLLLAGRLGDLLGRKRVFIFGVLLFTASSFLCGLAGDQALLIGARFLQGAGAAVMAAMVLSILVTLFPEPRQRVAAMSVYAFVASAGGSVGLLVGGVLTQAASWHWIFFINLPIGLAVLVLGSILIPGRKGLGLQHGVDVRGAILVTAAPSLAVSALVSAGQNGWGADLTLGLTALTALAALAFVVVESKVKNPLVPLRIFRSRARTGALVARLLFPVGLFGTYFLGSLYFQRVLGYGAVETGLAFLPSNLAVALFSLLITKRVVARFGPQASVLAGLGLVTGALVLLAEAPQHASYALNILPALLLLGVGSGLFFMPSIALAMSNTSPEDAGLASGLANVTLQVGAAFGIALVAGISSSTTSRLLASGSSAGAALTAGYHVGFLVAAAGVAVATLLAAILLRGRSVSRPVTVPVREAPRPGAAPALRPVPSWAALDDGVASELVLFATADEADREEAVA
ncbi:MAG TPA: DHA2 family efflux MFS transporter permease subunit [Candidatus Acidoferrales bacterium]|nr:DHA2 family efflux MFS transporter permease subunit [Candidatus Acidoferrales bacterium]